MARYFKKFPKTYYKLNDYNEQYITNIVSRFSLEPSFRNNLVAYYPYLIKEGDTPEIIASKVYGSVERHWIVLMVNDIVDPQFDWPLPYKAFNNFVNDKYISNAGVGQTGLEWAKTTVKSYYKVVSKKIGEVTTSNEYEIDYTTYTNTPVTTIETISLPNNVPMILTTTRNTKTYYDYEEELNENKKRIKLLNPNLVQAIEQEFEDLFENGTRSAI